MKQKKTISRRQFIRNASVAAIGTSILLGQETPAPLQTGKSKVILVRNRDVLDENGTPKLAVVQEMIDTGLKALTGKPDAANAWKSIIRPSDIVGIKTNVWTFIPTTAQVEQALKKGSSLPAWPKPTSPSTTAACCRIPFSRRRPR